MEAWLEKLGQRKSSAAGNAKRNNQEFDPVPFDAAIDVTAGLLAALNPNSRLLARRLPKTSRTPPVGTPDGFPSGSQGKGREGKGRDSDNLLPPSLTTSGAKEGGGEDSLFARFWAAYPPSPAASSFKTQEVFDGMTEVDQRKAISYLPTFRKAKTTNPMNPEKYLRDRVFDNLAMNNCANTELVKVERMSPEGDAWDAYERERNKGRPPAWTNNVWHFPTRWPPGHGAAPAPTHDQPRAAQ